MRTTKWQFIAMLAIGALFGYGAASLHWFSQPEIEAAPTSTTKSQTSP